MSDNDKKILQIMTQKKEIGDDKTCCFRVFYNNVKDFPEFKNCFSVEGKKYNDWLDIYVNCENGEIICEQCSDDVAYDVDLPLISEDLKQALICQAKQFNAISQEEEKQNILLEEDKDDREEEREV